VRLTAICSGPRYAALERTVLAYDFGAAAHSTRVAQAAAAMARSLGLPDEDVAVVSWSALLHDLGKLGVTIELLIKKGSLTETERAEIRRHPVIGAEAVLAVSAELVPIAEAIRAHHERWDGTGYPDRKAGRRIPLAARIIAVPDAFDALMHQRPYREVSLSPREAIREIQRGAATRFDPDLVAVFLDVHDRGLIPLP
jgi:putative nucleotidyltransferase with HDIG domain